MYYLSSALTKHVFDNEHSLDWTNAKIFNFDLDFTKRRFIASYFINEISNPMNDKQNDKFPSIYSATLQITLYYCLLSMFLIMNIPWIGPTPKF